MHQNLPIASCIYMHLSPKCQAAGRNSEAFATQICLKILKLSGATCLFPKLSCYSTKCRKQTLTDCHTQDVNHQQLQLHQASTSTSLWSSLSLKTWAMGSSKPRQGSHRPAPANSTPVNSSCDWRHRHGKYRWRSYRVVPPGCKLLYKPPKYSYITRSGALDIT